ncbi:hypothetical protein HNY73_000762 [Argiope bruennichi]|uniref:Uncharacterized protein n=1 Tax=Argiope bruennichi TaxID=94029 RepID=A0A8T0FZB3_ARGBR|nr:hypothetical protein HNY73_000762 [Argiope bruennichi]
MERAMSVVCGVLVWNGTGNECGLWSFGLEWKGNVWFVECLFGMERAMSVVCGVFVWNGTGNECDTQNGRFYTELMFNSFNSDSVVNRLTSVSLREIFNKLEDGMFLIEHSSTYLDYKPLFIQVDAIKKGDLSYLNILDLMFAAV